MAIRHVKGFNGRIPGGLAAHPSVPGQCFYAVGSSAVVMFEADPLKQVQLRVPDGGPISALDLSLDGALLATGQRGTHADVVLWDVTAGAPMAQRCRFEEHDAEVAALGFSHDGRLLATVGSEADGRLFVLDTSTGGIVARACLPDAQPRRVTALAWSPAVAGAASYAFATATELDVTLWGVGPRNALIHCEKVSMGSVRRAVTCLVFSACGTWLFAGTAGGDVLTINVARKAVQLMHSIAGAAGGSAAGIGHARLSADGGSLLVGTLDGALVGFNIAAALSTQRAAPSAAAVLAHLASVPGPISSISLTDGGAGALLGTRHGDVFAVRLGSGRQTAGGAAPPMPLLQSQQGALLDVAWEPRAPGAVVTTSDDGSVAAWDAATLELQCRFALPGGSALSVAASPELLLSGWGDGGIRCHSRLPSGPQQAPGAQLWCIPGAHARAHACGVTALKLSNRGDFVASGGAGGELRVWDAASREMVCHLKHHAAGITDLRVLRDDAHLVASSLDGTWSVWDVGAERVTRLCKAAMGAVRGVDVAPDQVSAVSGGLSRELCFWDMRCSDAPRAVVPAAHAREITCVAFNPSGDVVATGGADACVKLWDASSGALLGCHAGHTAPVNRLAFSPDGASLASVSSDGSMLLTDARL